MDLLRADPTPHEILVKGVLIGGPSATGPTTTWSPSGRGHSRCYLAVSERDGRAGLVRQSGGAVVLDSALTDTELRTLKAVAVPR